jgi:sec-independent protein translocase protein TatA
MPNIGPMEIILVLIVALIVFGPKKLPELGKSLGKGISEFKGTISGEHETPAPAAVEQHTAVAAPATRERAAETKTPVETGI